MFLAACQAPTTRERVTFSVDATGQCRMEKQSIPCSQAGHFALGHWQPDQLNAVLLISETAPRSDVEALRTSLQEAHVMHIQYGDPKSFKYDSSETGFHV